MSQLIYVFRILYLLSITTFKHVIYDLPLSYSVSLSLFTCRAVFVNYSKPSKLFFLYLENMCLLITTICLKFIFLHWQAKIILKRRHQLRISQSHIQMQRALMLLLAVLLALVLHTKQESSEMYESPFSVDPILPQDVSRRIAASPKDLDGVASEMRLLNSGTTARAVVKQRRRGYLMSQDTTLRPRRRVRKQRVQGSKASVPSDRRHSFQHTTKPADMRTSTAHPVKKVRKHKTNQNNHRQEVSKSIYES